MSANHDLFDFMSSNSQEIANEYSRIQKRATEDPGTAGDQGEENWADILRKWLPSTFKVVTKGRIVSIEGTASPQIDVLVLTPSYPEGLTGKKVYLAAGVAAAFECKVTLKAHHITEAIENCIAIKKLYREREGTPFKELHSPIVYGLLAHSHLWKGQASKPVHNIETRLIKDCLQLVSHPRELLDLVCVADLGTWVSQLITFIGPSVDRDWSESMIDIYGKNGSMVSAFVGHTSQSQNQEHTFTPLGGFISHLTQKLSWEYTTSQSIADYYRRANLGGSGQGLMQIWPTTVFSPNVKARVEAGYLVTGETWDEWSSHF